MTVISRFGLVASLGAALLALSARPAVASVPRVGISDQRPSNLRDPRLVETGFAGARVVGAWDVALHDDGRRAALDRWMDAAADAGQPVLFTPTDDGSHRVPTPRRYRGAMAALLDRYPHVDSVSTWNEANHPSQPTYHRQRLVAAYARTLRGLCAHDRCQTVAVELLDSGNLRSWTRAYRRYDPRPGVCGLHNYREANGRPGTRGQTAAFARWCGGAVWITETGGLRRVRRKHPKAGQSENRRYTLALQAKAVRRALRIGAQVRAIERIYLYHWRADSRSAWDSALIGVTGAPRPALGVVRSTLRRWLAVSPRVERREP